MSDVHEHHDTDKRHLVAIARSELSIRRARLSAFGPGWTGDSWWDILLVLYVERSGRGVDSGVLADQAGQSLALADRWLAILLAEGYVTRCETLSDDGRAVFKLSLNGCVKVEQCLAGDGEYRP